MQLTEPIKFEYLGKQCRIYNVGDIIGGPLYNDIVYDKIHNIFFLYTGVWESLNPTEPNKEFFLQLLSREPIKLAEKITPKEQEEKYNAFEHLLKF